MFDYDRIEFISSSQKKNIGNSNNNNFATVKHQSFDTTPTADDDEENSIAHSLKDILRHCSSSPVQNLPYNSIDSNENEVEEEVWYFRHFLPVKTLDLSSIQFLGLSTNERWFQL